MNNHNQKGHPNLRLKRERELLGWSQEKLAEEIGTTHKIVGRWERGESSPTHYYRERLCKLFGKNAAELGLIDQEVNSKSPDPSSEKIDGQVAALSLEVPSQQPTATAINGRPPIQLFLPKDSPHIVTIHIHQQASEENAIIDTRMTNTLGQERRREMDEIVNRREFNRKALGVAADLINIELLDRFQKALKKHTEIVNRLLHYY